MTSARSRRLFVTSAAVILAAALAGTSRAAVQVDASVSFQAAHSPRLDIDVWTNKEEGGVYRQGEPMRVFFRPSDDAYVLIYNIDTEGYIHLVYPYDPGDPDWVEGGRTYQVPSRNDPYDLVADGPTGIEYVVAIASPSPFRDLPWYLTGRADGRDPEAYRDDDDYEDSGVIVGDPYIAMDRVVRRVVPRGREDEVATSDTYFYIERRVDYPRYVCADCHSYRGWYDPYGDVCSVVSIRIDSGWAHYRPLRWSVLRPRYFYMVRSTAPTRYRQWKDRWSSVDGRATLRTRFQVDGTDKFRSRRQILQRRTPPEFQNLRRPRTEGRVWRRDEVLRRSDERRDRGDVREGRGRGDVREGQDPRRREWMEQRERRTNEQRQIQERRREDRRQNEDRRRDAVRERQERRGGERREAQERRREEQRQQVQERRERERSEARDDERRQNERREDARPREDRSNRDEDRGREYREDRGSRDRGRSEERRRDDESRGRGRR